MQSFNQYLIHSLPIEKIIDPIKLNVHPVPVQRHALIVSIAVDLSLIAAKQVRAATPEAAKAAAVTAPAAAPAIKPARQCLVDPSAFQVQMQRDDYGGDRLPSFDDQMLRPQTGKIAYLRIGRGGLFGIDENSVPAPWADSKSTTDAKLLALNTTKSDLAAAPHVKEDRFSSSDDLGAMRSRTATSRRWHPIRRGKCRRVSRKMTHVERAPSPETRNVWTAKGMPRYQKPALVRILSVAVRDDGQTPGADCLCLN